MYCFGEKKNTFLHDDIRGILLVICFFSVLIYLLIGRKSVVYTWHLCMYLAFSSQLQCSPRPASREGQLDYQLLQLWRHCGQLFIIYVANIINVPFTKKTCLLVGTNWLLISYCWMPFLNLNFNKYKLSLYILSVCTDVNYLCLIATIVTW